MTDDPNVVEIRRIDPKDWRPIFGDDLGRFIHRIANTTGSTDTQVVRSFKNPDHEFEFKFPANANLGNLADTIRMMGHEFGPWSVFTVWEENEYVYHATVQMGAGMSWEEAAGSIFQRWITTMPKLGGVFGGGKTRGQ